MALNSPCAQRAYLCRYREILNDMIAGMTKAELTDSVSHNFIVQMIPHHEAAIQMSENLLKYKVCAPLAEIAFGIIEEQTRSIVDMKRILDQCSGQTDTGVCAYQACVSRILRTMFSEMRRAPATGFLDRDFMREMIPHHEGAVRMSQNALRYPICPELTPILEAIITSQEQGIREMKRLLRCGC